MHSSISTAAATLPTSLLSHNEHKTVSNTCSHSRHCPEDCQQLPEHPTDPMQSLRSAQQQSHVAAASPPHAQANVTAHEQLQTHTGAEGSMHRCLTACLNRQSATQRFAVGTATLVSCTNVGAVRVLSLNGEHCRMSCARSAIKSGDQAEVWQMSGNADGLRCCMPTLLAAVQMPGDP